MSLTEPADIRAATVHPDPYPFYARLVVERPIYREGPAGEGSASPWVVTSAANVRAVLTHEFCATRPLGAVVPDITITRTTWRRSPIGQACRLMRSPTFSELRMP